MNGSRRGAAFKGTLQNSSAQLARGSGLLQPETNAASWDIFAVPRRGCECLATPKPGVRRTVKSAPPAYVSPAYKVPIVMRPESLRWKPSADRGVAYKAIGVLPHRGLVIQGIKLDAGTSVDLTPADTLRFLFITQGCGALEGRELRRWSVVRPAPGEGGQFSAQQTLEALELSVGKVDRPE
ncbi:hypothetical protein [Novosphingobium sp.]|uniref:hypothetical protein n=1 Tax=Novosphingobium sp. TaxID=1874826 RepID=UPI0026395B44|nr:hypothetical protein [Novosphingobium sp.]